MLWLCSYCSLITLWPNKMKIEHFVPDGQTDRQTDGHCDTLSSCRSQKFINKYLTWAASENSAKCLSIQESKQWTGVGTNKRHHDPQYMAPMALQVWKATFYINVKWLQNNLSIKYYWFLYYSCSSARASLCSCENEHWVARGLHRISLILRVQLPPGSRLSLVAEYQERRD